MRTRRLATVTLTALVILAAARPALALGPIDLEIAAKLGYGSDNLDLGLGGRAGVSLFGLYGGVNVENYFGQSSTSVLLYGGEIGFGFKVAFVTIRPQVGFGDAVYSFPVNAGLLGAGAGSSSTSTFYLQPGGLVQFGFGHLIFGVDAGALVPTAHGSSAAFTIDGQVGVRF